MTVKEFVLQLSPSNQESLQREYPEFYERLIACTLSDEDFASLLKQQRRFATHVFWLIIHSSYGGIAITKGYYKTLGKGCQSLCSLHRDDKKCPCIDSEWDWTHARDRENCNWLMIAYSKVEEYFLGDRDWNYNPNYEFVDWICGRIGSIQYKLLQEYCLMPPEPGRLPMCIRRLSEDEPKYGDIWIHRWFYGNEGMDSLSQRVNITDRNTLRKMVEKVDKAFEKSREIKAWLRKLEECKQKRIDSGIPLE